MAKQMRADQSLRIAALGVGTAILTGVILGLIEVWTGFAVYSVMIWFIIPVGALISGFAAASGYYIAAKCFHQKPAGGVALNMVLASVSAYLLAHYVPYYLLEIESVRIKDAISFWQYLDITIRHTSVSFNQSEVSTGELGSTFGYLYALIQLIGFSIGGFTVFGWLLDAPYCEKCSKYLSKTNTQVRYAGDAEKLPGQIQTFAEMLNERQYLKALSFHADHMGDNKFANHHLSSTIVVHKCQVCGVHHLDFGVSRRQESDWKEIPETRMKVWVDHRLEVTE